MILVEEFLQIPAVLVEESLHAAFLEYFLTIASSLPVSN